MILVRPPCAESCVEPRANDLVRSRARGFTLTEAALAMALVGIVAIAATSLYASVIRVFSNTRKTVMLTDRAQSVVDYLTHELRSIGGNGIPASQAIFVENAATCRGACVGGFPDGADGSLPGVGKADRLTIFTALQKVPPCPISAINGPLGDGSGTASFVMPPGSVAPGVCCFTTGGGGSFFERTVIFMKDGFYRAALLTNSSGTCNFKWQDIVPASMRTLPDPSTGATMSSAFQNGVAVLVDFRTIYLDPTTHDLIMHMDHNFTDATLNDYGNNPTVGGDRVRILDGVYDFQVALGYDLDYSGDVRETGGGANDEWLYNDPSELDPTSAGFVDPYDPTRLKLVRVETVVGLPSSGPSAGAPVACPSRGGQIFLKGVALRAAGTRVAPRNVDEPTFN